MGWAGIEALAHRLLDTWAGISRLLTAQIPMGNFPKYPPRSHHLPMKAAVGFGRVGLTQLYVRTAIYSNRTGYFACLITQPMGLPITQQVNQPEPNPTRPKAGLGSAGGYCMSRSGGLLTPKAQGSRASSPLQKNKDTKNFQSTDLKTEYQNHSWGKGGERAEGQFMGRGMQEEG